MGDYLIEAPFNKGQTMFGQTSADTADSINYEGREYTFQDLRFGAGRETRVRVVRNIAATTLFGKRLANLALSALTGVYYGCRIDGYAFTTAQKAYPIDDELLQGVAPQDLCYIVVRGLCLVTVELAAAAGNVINPGDLVTAVTAVTSQATTAGRVIAADFTGATLLLANQINSYHQAISAATTGSTGADLLIDVRY
jgi:hypothetical protein